MGMASQSQRFSYQAGIMVAMNPLMSTLKPYPFERLKELFSTVKPNAAYAPISLGIGEPRHATPQLVLDALAGHN